ncbi:Ivy family c-type lysozyme inhibitor [Janthinobacterium agaricidamnosum]|uniref:Inhibitor of vertebrate lysozyme family protein n=1 Tax=Janthinobacterium agaricidamnosum NBRC 102515 = DSM 9628 TaxID=1349767 RepID=W0V4A6_9BURK|nr:Ivy family c-type lysozyme inhibitor [Janthinobacterium agaricidamnosum]CDG82188.1 hypothetical protein GJA_1543 [Janthinobacterium agaricidamnosum NBRC 102515 = DSM 9628]
MQFQAKLLVIVSACALSFAALPAFAKKSPIEQALVCKDQTDCPYFPVVYKGDRAFKTAFLTELKKSGIKAPHWVPNGVSSPVVPVVFDGVTRLLTSVCQPHNCGEHRFVMLYDAQNKSISGLYIHGAENGVPVKTYFGNPSIAEQEILNKD